MSQKFVFQFSYQIFFFKFPDEFQHRIKSLLEVLDYFFFGIKLQSVYLRAKGGVRKFFGQH